MLRFFTSDIRRNLIKILCLTVGFAVGFLLVAKVYFEKTYDSFFPDSDRIYYVSECFTINGEYEEYSATPGGIVPGLLAYVPQIETATRYTSLIGEGNIALDDERTFAIEGINMADTCFFDVFSTPILVGDPHQALAVTDQVFIPRSLAEKIGGDPVGLRICVPEFSRDYKVTIAGIYEDFPLNSTIPNRIYLSLSSIGNFTYDGTRNWVGNDRYISFAKIARGTSPDDMKPYIETMLRENVDSETLDVFHFNINVSTPLVGSYTSRDGVRIMMWTLSLLAVIMILSASLNYLLIVIGQMGRRSKEMAIRKCYGTSNIRLFARVLCESAFYLIVSLLLAVLLIFCCSDLCTAILGYTPVQLLSVGHIWVIEVAICLVILVITGIIPAWIYCRTPVAAAFRRSPVNRRGWKLALLSIQFFASGLLLCLLVLIGRQYRLITDVNMGFEYENIGRVNLSGVPYNVRSTIADELRRLGCVDGVSSSDHDYFFNGSGNNVWVDGRWEDHVNVTDLYYANADILDVMGMKLTQGQTFLENADSVTHQVIVEERFADVLAKLGVDTTDNIVGQHFYITGHDGPAEVTICGVIGNMRRGGFESDAIDKRAAVFFPASSVRDNLYVRFNHLTSAALAEAQTVIDGIGYTDPLYITPYRERMNILTEPVRRFGTSVMIVGVAILVIAMVGLVGYTSDEVIRRAKEIAIRKVTGTTTGQIVRIFCKDILIVALPSLAAGAAVAMIVGRKWISQYSDQVSLSPVYMLACVLVILILLLCVVAANSLSIARSNPVVYLRNE